MRGREEGGGEVARVILRLAVLLGAGVAPPSAWRHVADRSTSEVPRRVADSADVATALAVAAESRPASESLAWRSLAAAWSLAEESGAPLGPALREQAAALRDLAEVHRDVEAALAGPVATTRIVATLPALGVLFGMALGFDTLGTFGTPAGIGCLVAGGALAVVAWRWMRRLVLAARPPVAAPGLEGDLLVIALGGGGSPTQARVAVERAAARFEIPLDLDRLDDTLALSVAAGVPATELVRAEASEARRQARSQARIAANALSARLMLPLGLAILPSFVLVGVVPLVLAVVSSTTALW